MDIKALDRILEMLGDSQWHLLEELKAKLLLPSEEKLDQIIRFLEKYKFLTFDAKEKKTKIGPLGLSLLQLPSEQEL
jgi:hypothetical protein